MPLLEADRSIFAWEWLRRNPGYREAAQRALGAARPGGERAGSEPWGLHAFEPPSLGAPHARPLWTAEVHPYVLEARADAARSASDSFDLGRFRAAATMVVAPGGHEHLLISDGLRAIRLDIAGGTLLAGPAQLNYRLAGIEAAARPVLALRRFLAFAGMGRFARSLHGGESRARRWVLMLRAFDALAAGAGQREIASLLLGRAAAEARWRSQTPSLRSQAQRLVRGARQMASGGYLGLLR